MEIFNVIIVFKDKTVLTKCENDKIIFQEAKIKIHNGR